MNASPRTIVKPPMPSRLRRALATAFAATLSAPAWAGAPFSFDTAFGRLPKNVVPLDYRVAITPDAKARTLRGSESVTLDVRQATATIVFNSLNQRLDHVTLDGQPVKRVVSDDKAQLTTVTLKAPAAVGQHVLAFTYRGKIETGPVGLFAQPFVTPDGRKDLLLSTQFEATDARRMFPCWDEPAFRATFELTATVPAEWATVSNMPVAERKVQGRLATTTFGRTPKMPSYLVEFTAGPLASIEAIGGTGTGATKFGVWAVRGQEQHGAMALENAQQILADYNDYFGFPYPLPKLDSIAVPGGFQGAMENWGAITYNDQNLLVTPSSTLANRQNLFSIQAHEMAHQWNGDLVTMGWWDDLWLNESFASWRAASETHLRHPEWNWWQRQDESKERAMAADARVASHPIQVHVADELEAENAFDPEITYAKGQAVLRMFEAYLGADTFRDGVRRFMKAHAYSNATSADLWASLQAASGRDVGAVAAAWTEQPGFPLVSVAARCDAAGQRTLALSQKRFLLLGGDAASAGSPSGGTPWSVPLQIRSGTAGTPQAVLLTQDGQSVLAGRCDEPLSANADAIGFYRVAYDDATLKANLRDFARLPAGDRIALLDDQWALATTGAQPLPNYLALVEAMAADNGELNERAWSQAADALGEIEFNQRGAPGHDAFATYARSVLKPVATRLGWQAHADETPGVQKLRRRLLEDLGSWGDADVIAEARRRFAEFAADRDRIAPDDQAFILGIVARQADAATFAQLHQIAKTARNETELRRYYEALMQVRDPALAAQAAKIAMSPEIPQQAAAIRFGLVAELSDANPQIAWDLYTAQVKTLIAPLQPFGEATVAQTTPRLFWRTVSLDKLQAWTKAHVPEGLAPQMARGMETARFKLQQQALLRKASDEYTAALKTAVGSR